MPMRNSEVVSLSQGPPDCLLTYFIYFIYFATSKLQSNTEQKLIIKLIIITM